MTEVEKIKREDLPEDIWKICEEFKAVFPKDLAKGVPPRRIGHEFKIYLEPDTALSIGPSTSSAHSSSRKQRRRLIQCSSMASSDPLNPHGIPLYYLYRRKTAAFGTVWITVG